MHGGLFSEDGVTLEDLRKIERNRQPPDSGTADVFSGLRLPESRKVFSFTVLLLFCRPHVRPALVRSTASG